MEIVGDFDGSTIRPGIVVARWNAAVTDRLEAGALDAFRRHGVMDDRITVWLDEKKIIDVQTRDRKFSIWWEQEPVTPLGLVTWRTTGALKDLQFRRVAP